MEPFFSAETIFYPENPSFPLLNTCENNDVYAKLVLTRLEEDFWDFSGNGSLLLQGYIEGRSAIGLVTQMPIELAIKYSLGAIQEVKIFRHRIMAPPQLVLQNILSK
jgi:hypothetical protein